MFLPSVRRLVSRFDPVEIARKKKLKRKLYFGAGLVIAVGTFEYKFRECLSIVDNPSGILNPHRLFFARIFFGRLRSSMIGSIAEKKLPVSMRSIIYGTYAKLTGVDLGEMRYPIEAYSSLQEFFSRPLKANLRIPETTDPLCLVSPADSEIICCGDINPNEDRLPQIKNTSYSLRGFLGSSALPSTSVSTSHSPVWKYVVLYLCPGDYHRFHSPTVFQVDSAKHFSGEVLSVNKLSLAFLNDVFSVNERVVLAGTWAQGTMYYAAVAAHGVGNIKLSFENKLRTNDVRTVPVYCGGDVRTRNFSENFSHGSEIGTFKLGSTIVLIFEASENMQWNVKSGDKVKVGQTLLSVKS